MIQISSKRCKKPAGTVTHLITDYRLLITSLALSLTGCMGVYEGGFECPPGEGVGCKSISEVNHMVDQGLGNKNSSPQRAQKTEHSMPTCKNGSGSCSSPKIWYAPTFDVKQKEKCPTKALDDAHSI